MTPARLLFAPAIRSRRIDRIQNRSDEELSASRSVAELGTAFLTAQLTLRGTLRHIARELQPEPKVIKFVKQLGEIIGDLTVHLATDMPSAFRADRGARLHWIRS